MVILFFELTLIVLIIVIIIAMVYSLLKNKVYKNKEECLILINQFCTLLMIFSFLIYIFLLLFIENNHFLKIYYNILNYSFDVYIIFLFANNYMIVLDYYYTYTYPIHFFSYVLKINKNVKNYHIIFFTLIICIISLFDILYCEIEDFKEFFSKIPYIYMSNSSLFQCNEFDDGNMENSFPFIITNKYRGFILIIINFLTIMHILFFLWQIGNFSFNKNHLLKKNLIIKLTINMLYLLYAISTIFLNNKIGPILNSLFILIIILIQNIMFVLNYSLSKFVQFKLEKSIFGKIGLTLLKCRHKKKEFLPLTYSTDYFENISTLLVKSNSSNSFNDNLNPFDQELLLMYQNGIFLEDYYLNYLDQTLNIITSSLYKLYNSEFMSTKEINNQKLGKELNITVSSISGEGLSWFSGLNGSFGKDEFIISENLSSFTFYKNNVVNDYSLFQDILDNNNMKNNNIRVKIYSYYTNSCINNILEKNFSSKNIAKSLISHMNIKEFNDSNSSSQEGTPFNYSSLTVANAKESNFINLNNICFKTFDKKYSLEMFETNDKINKLEINSSNRKNNISDLIDKYFLYLQLAGINNTFLPIILGIFKITINDFKPLLIIITDNSIVENVPIQNYTNWQLIRFEEKGINKIASSRFNRNTIIDDDIIFKKVSKKEKEIYNEIKLNNYEEVKNVILSDISFLKKVGSYSFSLLLMYYQYEGNEKHEKYVKNGVIKIRNSLDNKPEIIDDILPVKCLYNSSIISNESEEMSGDINNSIKFVIKNKSISSKNSNNSKSKKSVNSSNRIGKENDIQSFENMSDDFYNKKKMNENLINFSDQINITGYNGIFDSYNCLCYFNFENIFENQNNYKHNYKFYQDYLKKIMKYFSPLNGKVKNDDNFDLNYIIN